MRDWVGRAPSFFTNEAMLIEKDGKLSKIAKPDDADAAVWDDQLLIQLRKDWVIGDKTWPGGSLLVSKLDDFRAGKRDAINQRKNVPSRLCRQLSWRTPFRGNRVVLTVPR